MSITNMGRFYEKEYFKFSQDEQKKILKLISEDKKLDSYENTIKNRGKKELIEQNISHYKEYCKLFEIPLSNIKIELKTTYPGLIIGSGSPHECGIKGEFKLSLSFEYTTGLPYIPASSVKGLLRSIFPNEKDRYKSEKEEILLEYFKEKGCKKSIKDLEKELFDSNGKNIFFDAYIKSEDRLFLDEDYITPHGDNLLKNPTPLRFLKIRPDTTIIFQFKIEDDMKSFVKDFFENILLDFGIGAKTNVGYGQFAKQ